MILKEAFTKDFEIKTLGAGFVAIIDYTYLIVFTLGIIFGYTLSVVIGKYREWNRKSD